jgi:predicted amidohydrolase/GNAT superfamily N-acetyltransferase
MTKETMNKNRSKKKAGLIVRNAKTDDIDGILQLIAKVYPDFPPYTPNMLRGQINSFPEGHFIAQADHSIVGYSASIILDEKKALSKHTWREITGSGFGSTHDLDGDYLYGYEVCVDPQYRGVKIGQRFYQARKELCKFWRLKGIVFGGRIPRLAGKINKVGSVEEYVKQVQAKKLRDPVLSFQLRNGFEVIGILDNYLSSDKDSLGYAIHLLWKNPEHPHEMEQRQTKRKRPKETVRLAAVQYQQRAIRSFDEFVQIVTYFVDVVADYQSDFVLFPELFSLQLLSIENEQVQPHKAIEKMSQYTDDFKDFFYKLAIKYNINIIAGSHPTHQKDQGVRNVSYIFLRDGSIHEQEKIHPTPSERYWWNIEGGDTVTAIDTDCGPIGVLVCYDSEFPELSRHLVDQGANILFIPFLTDEKQSYNRVRYCAQARAIEGQCYVVMAGNVGNLPRVHNMDIHYAQSCILTPCDFAFSRDGIAADTTPNVETLAIADVSLTNLRQARHQGTVQNLRDRRHDLYSVVWHKK